MKIFKLIFALLLLSLIGGFVYLAVTDINVEQTQVVKTIPAETIFNDQ